MNFLSAPSILLFLELCCKTNGIALTETDETILTYSGDILTLIQVGLMCSFPWRSRVSAMETPLHALSWNLQSAHVSIKVEKIIIKGKSNKLRIKQILNSSYNNLQLLTNLKHDSMRTRAREKACATRIWDWVFASHEHASIILQMELCV